VKRIFKIELHPDS